MKKYRERERERERERDIPVSNNRFVVSKFRSLYNVPNCSETFVSAFIVTLYSFSLTVLHIILPPMS